jgi:hypothetical protein
MASKGADPNDPFAQSFVDQGMEGQMKSDKDHIQTTKRETAHTYF